MDIFESLENLNVSEECFDEIMGLVEEVINELYPATPRNVEKAVNRRIKQYKKAGEDLAKAEKESEKSGLRETRLGKKFHNLLRKQIDARKKGDKKRSEGINDFSYSKDDIYDTSALKKMVKGQEELDKVKKMEDKVNKAREAHRVEKRSLEKKVEDNEKRKEEAFDKAGRVEELARNHFALKHNNAHKAQRKGVLKSYPKFDIGKGLY